MNHSSKWFRTHVTIQSIPLRLLRHSKESSMSNNLAKLSRAVPKMKTVLYLRMLVTLKNPAKLNLTMRTETTETSKTDRKKIIIVKFNFYNKTAQIRIKSQRDNPMKMTWMSMFLKGLKEVNGDQSRNIETPP